MKLNFWQWLGVVLLIIGSVWWIYGKINAPKATPDTNPPATTLPMPPSTVPSGG